MASATYWVARPSTFGDHTRAPDRHEASGYDDPAAMSIHRAARGLFASAIALAVCTITPTPAGAQAATGVSLRLVSQTPWATLKDPVIEIAVLARNDGSDAVSDLTLGITIGAAVRSRNVYEQSLIDGPTLPIDARTISETGTLAPGDERRFRVSVDLSTIGGVSAVDSLVYPMRLDIRSAGTPVVVLDSSIIFLVRKPEVPLLLTSVVELSAPIALGPDGRLADPSFEAAIAPTGTLGAEVAALDRMAEDALSPVELVVQPSLLDQLERMADGYQRVDGTSVAGGQGAAADAAALLARLTRIGGSPSVNVVALPFAAPTVPSLLSSGLASDVATQTASGREAVHRILGVEPTATVARPTAGALDDAAIGAFAVLGATTIIGNADTVERPPQPNEFAPPPTASVAVGAQTQTLILPDPGTQGLLAGTGFLDDPVRAAQATLGELAAVWREQPVPSSPRGVAVSLPSGLPSRFWGAFLGRIASAPFLRSISAEDIVAQIPPPSAPSTLASPPAARFSPGYTEAIKRERRDLLAFRSMMVKGSPIPDRLARDLLYAESAEYLGNEGAGRAWIDQVNRITEAVFARAVPDTSQEFTFLAETGSIPLTMGDPDDMPIRFSLQLRSSRFLFPHGDRQAVTLTGPDQIVTFQAKALASGQGTIQVVVRAPSGRPIGQTQLTVRSTSVNHIALAVTIAAAVLLLVLWSRRLFRRPTS